MTTIEGPGLLPKPRALWLALSAAFGAGLVVACGDVAPTQTPVYIVVTATAQSATVPTFSGTGNLKESTPFTLANGTYNVTWAEHPLNVNWPYRTAYFGASIHAPASMDIGLSYHRLVVEQPVIAAGDQSRIVVVPDVVAGTYVLEVRADPPLAWTIAIGP